MHDLHNPKRITSEKLVSGLEINQGIPMLLNPRTPLAGWLRQIPKWFARSPDGRYMAFAAAGTNIPDIYRGNGSRKSDPPDRFIRSGDGAYTCGKYTAIFLRLSPDSEQLAMYAEDSYNRRGIYLLDLPNEEARLLRDINSATGLVWNPNGKQLA